MLSLSIGGSSSSNLLRSFDFVRGTSVNQYGLNRASTLQALSLVGLRKA